MVERTVKGEEKQLKRSEVDMRLIDADEFILSLNDYIDKPITVGLCATLVHLFPTAYDIDKVEEELETYKAKHMGSDGHYISIINKAIEIVKQGVR